MCAPVWGSGYVILPAADEGPRCWHQELSVQVVRKAEVRTSTRMFSIPLQRKYTCNIANPEVLCVCPLLTVLSEQCRCLCGQWRWNHVVGM